LLFSLTSCWDDDASITLTPNQALEGQWEVNRGVFIWDNGERISSLNPLVDSLPSVLVQFTEDSRYKIQYAFFVTNGFDQDTVTLANGIQEGVYELLTTEDQPLEYNGEIILTENITKITGEADIRFQTGNSTDSLWLEGVQLNSLLQGEISGEFFRNTK
jgi:hypothetical protein